MLNRGFLDWKYSNILRFKSFLKTNGNSTIVRGHRTDFGSRPVSIDVRRPNQSFSKTDVPTENPSDKFIKISGFQLTVYYIAEFPRNSLPFLPISDNFFLV